MELSDKQIDHLILLVGGNPLPNAVVAKLIAKPETAITLLHSEDTQAIASQLQKWLNEQHYANIALKLVHESGPRSIYLRVQESLNSALSNVKSDRPRVVLNYTGGTKAMAVHAYRAVELWAKESPIAKSKIIHPEYCYLDARSDMLVWDPMCPDGRVREEYVGNQLILKLADMLTLHNRQISNSPNPKAILPESATALAKVYSDQETAKTYIQWKAAQLWKYCRKDDGQKRIWKNCDELYNTNIEWPSDSKLQPFTATIKKELAQTDDVMLHIGRATVTSGLKSPSEFCQWLDGKWLEQRVLLALTQLRDRSVLDECLQNVETKGARFEIDDVAIRGYQLYVLTCGTDTDIGGGGRARLKLKLFESLIRARQIGGDAARVALVCCADDPNGLLEEVRRDLDPEQRCRVFGREQLVDLEGWIETWFKTEKGG